jgi:hypothetical protein
MSVRSNGMANCTLENRRAALLLQATMVCLLTRNNKISQTPFLRYQSLPKDSKNETGVLQIPCTPTHLVEGYRHAPECGHCMHTHERTSAQRTAQTQGLALDFATQGAEQRLYPVGQVVGLHELLPARMQCFTGPICNASCRSAHSPIAIKQSSWATDRTTGRGTRWNNSNNCRGNHSVAYTADVRVA